MATEQAQQDGGCEFVGLVISDTAPSINSTNSIDQLTAISLILRALDMAQQVLKPNGDLVAEVFRRAGFDQYLADVRTSFTKVVTCKPDSSRIWSREADIAGLVKKRRE